MATNFDKALYQTPQGLSDEDMGGDIEIEVEDPESMSIGLDGLETVSYTHLRAHET